MEEQQIVELLEKNYQISQEIQKSVKKINHHLMWASVMSWLKIIIFITPFIIGYIYFLPFVRTIYDQYRSVLGGGSEMRTESGSGVMDNISPEIRRLLEK